MPLFLRGLSAFRCPLFLLLHPPLFRSLAPARVAMGCSMAHAPACHPLVCGRVVTHRSIFLSLLLFPLRSFFRVALHLFTPLFWPTPTSSAFTSTRFPVPAFRRFLAPHPLPVLVVSLPLSQAFRFSNSRPSARPPAILLFLAVRLLHLGLPSRLGLSVGCIFSTHL